MNTHLNVFKTYTREDREYQLENDLTSALAICMQEDSLFFHEVLKIIFKNNNSFSALFNDIDSQNEFDIAIQVKASDIRGFKQIIAVSLSGFEMKEDYFWEQNNHNNYDPICDIVIRINDLVVIIETKRNSDDCTSQLYNQAYNILVNSNITIENIKDIVQPFDLNWKKLMTLAIKVFSFETMVDNKNRFLSDFIQFVRMHNSSWLPETPIASLRPDNMNNILKRIESSLIELDKENEYVKLNYTDRLGLEFKKGWAQEILFDISSDGSLVVAVFPGNTKAQGRYIFKESFKISETILLLGVNYDVEMCYHIKLTGFQKYFTGLWFSDEDLLEEGLYSIDNFNNYTGRKYSGQDWERIEDLFDKYFKPEYNWRSKMNWDVKVLESNRTQFDMSFGYELAIEIPFETLKKYDTNQGDLSGLNNLIKACYKSFQNDLIK